jgi:hypothetical protein
MTSPTRPHTVTKWRGLDNFSCTSCQFSSLDAGRFDGHSCRGEVRLAPPALDGALFASPSARDSAGEAGLVDASFAGRQPSSASGFTVSDVRTIVADLQE